MKFEVLTSDGRARRSVLTLDRRRVDTPIFMPVGTRGAVKTVTPDEVAASGAQIILGNTFHLMLRPGVQVIAQHGTLHNFMGWDGPILTDSGGFQVWSLAERRRISEEGVTFQSPFDGSTVFLGPEESMQVQQGLGSDIAMTFDECTDYPATYEEAKRSMDLSMRWAARCRDAHSGSQQLLFGIAQGSVFPELRSSSLESLVSLGFDGYALGGLSVGEPKTKMYEILDDCTPLMPTDAPRYLMGVGKPEDLLRGVAAGIDMFDCVLPTRNARNGWLYTWDGVLKVKNARHRQDTRPIDETCSCPCCSTYSRSYLRHLFVNNEGLGQRLCTVHNLWFFGQLMQEIRLAIEEKRFDSFHRGFLLRYLE